jgi:intracellular sulfur oxidation DsrE/DsrF family protein
MSIVSTLIRVPVAALLLIGMAGLATPAQATDKTAKSSVVIQVSENNPAIWNLALNNAKNIQQDLGKENVNIEIVAYGPGINMLKFDSEVAPRLKEAGASGVALLACGNTMKNQKLTEKDLDGNVKVVKAGVIEIINKQREGWAYIKP